MEFTRCPYDASPIEAEPAPAGSTLLCCALCGASWEWNNTRLQRVREPDRDAVRAARAAREPVAVIRGVPNPALADAMWQEMTEPRSRPS